MANLPQFTLPAELKLEVSEEGLHLEFPGDVVIEQDLGRGLHTIVAAGDLTLRIPRITGNVRAGGVLRVEGEVDAGYLHGRVVLLASRDVRCVAVSADERIAIGAAAVAADAIIAPRLEIDGAATGRVTVMESLNDPGPTKIKGGFSVADYDDMFGEADDFLAQRGLQRLDAAAPAELPDPDELADLADPAEPAPQAPSRQVAASAVDTRTSPAAPPPRRPLTDPLTDDPTGPHPASPTTAGRSSRSLVRGAAPVAGLSAVVEEDEEDEHDPLSLSLDELEPMVGRKSPRSDPDPALYLRLSDAVTRIVACYEGQDLPPAVQELADLVEQRDYGALRTTITEVWNGLLGFHQQRGIRPHHQVTHAFNVIHGLVQSPV